MNNMFTDGVKRVMQYAREESARLGTITLARSIYCSASSKRAKAGGQRPHEPRTKPGNG